MDNNKESFADLFNEGSSQKLHHFSPGQKVTASIVAISGENVFLDVGGKSEGVMDLTEIQNDEGDVTLAVGDRLEVYFLSSKNAELMFTTKVGSGSGAAHLEEAFEAGIPVEGFVKAEIKGGFEITLGGNVRGFCPYSQMGLRRVDDAAATYLETHMTFRITRFESNGRNIVVSARAILEEEREAKQEELKQTLNEGDLVDGEITSIRDFGAFVDIGGVDGLIPISEIGWSRVENVSEFFSVGQKVSAIIKKLDWDNNKISLSYKETQKDPWSEAAASFPEGTVQQGTVSRLANFGAFVTLGPGVDGLIHISKLGGGRRINHPREAVEEGQQLEVKIESVDTDERRISLSPADYESEEKKEEKERKEYTSYMSQSKKKQKSDGNLGSFGELLQAKMKEKKK